MISAYLVCSWGNEFLSSVCAAVGVASLPRMRTEKLGAYGHLGATDSRERDGQSFGYVSRCQPKRWRSNTFLGWQQLPASKLQISKAACILRRHLSHEPIGF